MVARQFHGFSEEEKIKQTYEVFDPKDGSYTSEWDGAINAQHVIGSSKPNHSAEMVLPVSIKTKSLGGSVEMGSLLRNSVKEEDFVLTVAFWKTAKHNIVKRDFILIPRELWLERSTQS